jgi:hypothetical protein
LLFAFFALKAIYPPSCEIHFFSHHLKSVDIS